MAKKLQKKSDYKKKEIIKYEPDRTRDNLREFMADCQSPDSFLRDFNDVAKKYFKGNKKEKKELLNDFGRHYNGALVIMSLDNHIVLGSSVTEKYKLLIVEVVNNLIKEYNCNTTDEKILAEIMANAYIRMIHFSKKMTRASDIEHATKENNTLISIMSKEIDRAQRQFTNTLITLKQLKSPNLKINVTAKNAFVAQNQQVNIGDKEKDKDDKKHL